MPGRSRLGHLSSPGYFGRVTPIPRRSPAVLGALLVALALTACTPTATPEISPSAAPSSSAPSVEPTVSEPSASATEAPSTAAGDLTYLAVGDSLTTGFASCETMIGCEAVSWALGTEPGVRSIAGRLGEAGYAVTSVDAAREGATMSDGVALVDEAFAQPGAPAAVDVDLVTVMFGANDVCGNSAERMTSPAAFGEALTGLLDHLAALAPEAVVVVTSIPDITAVREAGQDDPAARERWALGLCQTILGDDDAARALATTRLAELDAVITETCTARATCRTDDGAVAASEVTLAWLSEWDYFHPSTEGQTLLAAAAWPSVGAALGLEPGAGA